MDLNNWLIKDESGTPTYYGYAKPGANTGDTKWIILKETVSGSVTTRYWAGNDFMYDKIWNDKEHYFSEPSSEATLEYSGITYSKNIVTISLKWDYVKGVNKYYLTIMDKDTKETVWPHNNNSLKLNEDLKIVQRANVLKDRTYIVRLRTSNPYGETKSEFEIET